MSPFLIPECSDGGVRPLPAYFSLSAGKNVASAPRPAPSTASGRRHTGCQNTGLTSANSAPRSAASASQRLIMTRLMPVG